MNQQTARKGEAPVSRHRSATIIRFPFTLTVHPSSSEGRKRPSLALNLLLVLLLVLACVLWETVSSRLKTAEDLRSSPVTAPRAAAADATAAPTGD